jgi:hypothetical protein
MFAVVALSLAFSTGSRSLQEDTVPVRLKLQAKMTMEFCSKNPTSELLPCKEAVFQDSLKGLGKEERLAKINEAVIVIEEKRKKKIAIAMHDDNQMIYQQFCATGKKEMSEICVNSELKQYLESPLNLSGFKGRGYADQF